MRLQKDLNTITNTLLLLISGRNATSLMAQGFSPQLSLLPWAVGSLSACLYIMVQLSANRYHWVKHDAEKLRPTIIQLGEISMHRRCTTNTTALLGFIFAIYQVLIGWCLSGLLPKSSCIGCMKPIHNEFSKLDESWSKLESWLKCEIL